MDRMWQRITKSHKGAPQQQWHACAQSHLQWPHGRVSSHIALDSMPRGVQQQSTSQTNHNSCTQAQCRAPCMPSIGSRLLQELPQLQRVTTISTYHISN